MKEKIHIVMLTLTPLFHGFLLFFGFYGLGIIPAAIIFFSAEKLGYFWLPLQAGHLGLFWYAARRLNRKKEMNEVRMLLQDDEAFYSMYPREKKRVERIERFRAWRFEHMKTKAV